MGTVVVGAPAAVIMVANGGGAIMEELLMGSMSGSDGRSDI